jgi:hypothetical protein
MVTETQCLSMRYDAAAPITREERMKAHAVVAALVLSLVPTLAGAGSFDGKWQVEGDRSKACPPFTAEITVSGNKVAVTVGGKDRYTLNGAVAPDGSFKVGQSLPTASGKFTGDAVELTLTAGCGLRGGSGHRAS